MKKIWILFLFVSFKTQAQELFVYTEPASNMPFGSLGIRMANMLMDEKNSSSYEYHLVPELMWGVNKRLMLHADAFLSNADKKFAAEGGSFYAKYRFLSTDQVHTHFRMAGYGRYSFNNSEIHQQEIDLYGHNSGWQAGIVATQLLHKVALSANFSYLHAMNNGNDNKFPDVQSNNAVNYSLSFGKLMLPKEYTDYNQTNMNLMVELLGQTLGSRNGSYLDIASSVQFIFKSQARVDIGYRLQLMSSMYRTSPNGFLLRFEYLIFNAFKK
ncbi:hypothetical protein BH10BAC2_BH10BAC2_45730 [soil metagenome]